jgi:hypothetical protein
MNDACTCGCCEGVEILTPAPVANRPGLPALSFRAGTHATFMATMLARLSSTDFPALAALKTRDPADPAIALLDSWATVADVLTFYQERIANEGYLRTATERRSVLELARLIGYNLRPGVASSVYLAYTLGEDLSQNPPVPTETLIPQGTRSQSVPGPGETPQSFETSDDLDARSAWNNLQVRLTRPQFITLPTDESPVADSGTDATTRDTLYLDGISTNLKSGDALLIVLSDDSGMQALRFVEAVDVQVDQGRTEVTLQTPLLTPLKDMIASDAVKLVLKPFVNDAATIFAGSSLANQAATILGNSSDPQAPPGLLDNITSDVAGREAAELVRGTIPKVQAIYSLAKTRNFTRLEPWLAQLLDALYSLVQQLPPLTSRDGPVGGGAGGPTPPKPSQTGPEKQFVPSALGNLGALLDPLSTPPSLQPPNSLRLNRTKAQAFSSQSDIAPRLLAALRPAAAPALYRAWTAMETISSQVQVYALRQKAAPFGNNAPKQANIPRDGQGGPVTLSEWNFSDTDVNNPSILCLDSVNDKISPDSWVVVSLGGPGAANEPLITRIQGVDTVSRADYGMAGRVTELTLPQSWLPDNIDKETAITTLRNTTVFAQAELLELAEEPLDVDLEGNTIELDDVYDGLESGRWIIVSGERTDIPNVTGVTASELVMVAGVAQGLVSPGCANFPSSSGIPFSDVKYVTEANVYGDRLVVGTLQVDPSLFLPATTPTANQQYCEQIELAGGFWVNAYVPTSSELAGDFGDFEGLLFDSSGNVIMMVPPAKTFQPFGDAPTPGSLWAWRISTAKPHTILTLANPLAYTYDLGSVTIYGNVVKATNGETRNEVLGNGDASQELQSFALKQSPLTFVAAPNPSGVVSTLVVSVNQVNWQETDTLAGLGPKDREFITQTDENANTTVIFGNGQEGARLPTGTGNVKAVYRNGIGTPGNVDAGQITLLQTKPLNVKSVINPLAASGGADADTLEQARGNAPLEVMALDRLVSTQDYADFSRTFAGIGKASAVRLTDGHRQLVHVTIAGAEDIPIDTTSDLYQNLVQALHDFGDPYQPIQVAVRRLRLVIISVNVAILPDYSWESVAAEIRPTLLTTFAFESRNLGQPVVQSEVISAIQGVAGVSYVSLQLLDSFAEAATVQQTIQNLAGLAGTLGLNDYIGASLAGLNPDPAADPASRILAAELACLTPDVPGTLILNQITT